MIFNQLGLEAIVQRNDYNDDSNFVSCWCCEKIEYLDAHTHENTICVRYTTSYGN